MRSCAVVASLLLALVLAFPRKNAAAQAADAAPVPAATDAAVAASTQALFDEARALFDRGQYAEAATVFARLHIQTEDPVVLYPLAQSQRLAGQCTAALASYQQFIAAEDGLRQRADAAAPGSSLKRVASDLLYARGRVVEMRICQSRPRLSAARQAAQRGLAASDPGAAIAALQKVWDDDRDPTALVDLAQLHQARSECPAATRSLDQAIEELTPTEALRAAGAPGSDLAEALGTLQRARQARQDLDCSAPPAVVRSPPAASPAVALAPPGPAPQASTLLAPRPVDVSQSSAAPARRWPLLVAAGGGVVVAAGLFSLWKAAQTADQLSEQARKNDLEWEWDDDSLALDRSNRRYNLAGITLTATGAAVAGGALIYHFLHRSPETVALVPVLQISRGDAALGFRAFF
jgi:hypothetical protein